MAVKAWCMCLAIVSTALAVVTPVDEPGSGDHPECQHPSNQLFVVAVTCTEPCHGGGGDDVDQRCATNMRVELLVGIEGWQPARKPAFVFHRAYWP